jgi:hypothetical protein
MELESSLPFLQKPCTDPHPEQHGLSPHSRKLSSGCTLLLSSSLPLGIQSIIRFRFFDLVILFKEIGYGKYINKITEDVWQ